MNEKNNDELSKALLHFYNNNISVKINKHLDLNNDDIKNLLHQVNIKSIIARYVEIANPSVDDDDFNEMIAKHLDIFSIFNTPYYENLLSENIKTFEQFINYKEKFLKDNRALIGKTAEEFLNFYNQYLGKYQFIESNIDYKEVSKYLSELGTKDFIKWLEDTPNEYKDLLSKRNDNYFIFLFGIIETIFDDWRTSHIIDRIVSNDPILNDNNGTDKITLNNDMTEEQFEAYRSQLRELYHFCLLKVAQPFTNIFSLFNFENLNKDTNINYLKVLDFGETKKDLITNYNIVSISVNDDDPNKDSKIKDWAKDIKEWVVGFTNEQEKVINTKALTNNIDENATLDEMITARKEQSPNELSTFLKNRPNGYYYNLLGKEHFGTTKSNYKIQNATEEEGGLTYRNKLKISVKGYDDGYLLIPNGTEEFLAENHQIVIELLNYFSAILKKKEENEDITLTYQELQEKGILKENSETHGIRTRLLLIKLLDLLKEARFRTSRTHYESLINDANKIISDTKDGAIKKHARNRIEYYKSQLLEKESFSNISIIEDYAKPIGQDQLFKIRFTKSFFEKSKFELEKVQVPQNYRKIYNESPKVANFIIYLSRIFGINNKKLNKKLSKREELIHSINNCDNKIKELNDQYLTSHNEETLKNLNINKADKEKLNLDLSNIEKDITINIHRTYFFKIETLANYLPNPYDIKIFDKNLVKKDDYDFIITDPKIFYRKEEYVFAQLKETLDYLQKERVLLYEFDKEMFERDDKNKARLDKPKKDFEVYFVKIILLFDLNQIKTEKEKLKELKFKHLSL